MVAHTLGVVDDRRWAFGIRARYEERTASRGEGIGAVAISSTRAAELPTCTAPAAAGDHPVGGAALDGAGRGFMFGVAARNPSQVV